MEHNDTQYSDLLYAKMAYAKSKNSKAKRLQVGAVITFVYKDRYVAFSGFNHIPAHSTEPIEFDDGNGGLVSNPDVVHAEVHAIGKAIAAGFNPNNAIRLYVTHNPCLECAKRIVSHGIESVVYQNEYCSDAGLEYLSRHNVEVVKFSV